MTREEKKEGMSVVGKRIWLHMQDHSPPWNRKTYAEHLSETGIYQTSDSSVGNYLLRQHPPPEFINAVIDDFGLSLEETDELYWLYFRGTRRPSQENWDRSRSLEKEESSDQARGRADGIAS